jgi:hypothetical protein
LKFFTIGTGEDITIAEFACEVAGVDYQRWQSMECRRSAWQNEKHARAKQE